MSRWDLPQWTEAWLWTRVAPEPNCGCWLWLGNSATGIYGTISIKGKCRLAHRAFYERFAGPITTGMQVLHRCDVPRCVNPDHLFLGTNLDNIRDRMAKGRKRTGHKIRKHHGPVTLPRGDRNPMAKLTETEVFEIRAACASGEAHPSVARRFGVSSSLVSMIKTRKIWAHLPEAPDGH